MSNQFSLLARTEDDAPSELLGSQSSRIGVPADSALRVSGVCVARESAGAAHEWAFTALIANTNGTVAMVGTPIITETAFDAQAEAWAIAITADDTNKALVVTATGAIGATIEWVASATIIAVTDSGSIDVTIDPSMILTQRSGDNQVSGIRNELTLPLSVRLTDASKAAVVGALVTFSVSKYPVGSTMHYLSQTSVVTDSNGIASAMFTPGEIAGAYEVSATAGELAPVHFSVIAIALVSLSEAKAYLNTDKTTHDNLYATWIGRVSMEIENRCRQPIYPRPITELINGSGYSRVYLNKGQIVDLQQDDSGSKLSSLQVRNSVKEPWANVVDDEAYIYIDPIKRWHIDLLDFQLFQVGIKNIRIDYMAGYAPIPSDLVELAKKMLQSMWDSSKVGGTPRLGLSGKNMGAAGASGGDTFRDMETVWTPIINRYRRLL